MKKALETLRAKDFSNLTLADMAERIDREVSQVGAAVWATEFIYEGDDRDIFIKIGVKADGDKACERHEGQDNQSE